MTKTQARIKHCGSHRNRRWSRRHQTRRRCGRGTASASQCASAQQRFSLRFGRIRIRKQDVGRVLARHKRQARDVGLGAACTAETVATRQRIQRQRLQTHSERERAVKKKTARQVAESSSLGTCDSDSISFMVIVLPPVVVTVAFRQSGSPLHTLSVMRDMVTPPVKRRNETSRDEPAGQRTAIALTRSIAAQPLLFTAQHCDNADEHTRATVNLVVVRTKQIVD